MMFLQTNSGIVPQLDHDCIIPDPFQFVIHLSSYHLTVYSLAADSVVKQSSLKVKTSEYS
jgi:hypothetical protein